MHYKLVNQDLCTHNGFQWEIGKWRLAKGSGLKGLCSDGWLHCYDNPLLAVLFNPVHADIKNPRMFEVEVGGFARYDKGLKTGFRAMRIAREIHVPSITMKQKARFGILCAKAVYTDKSWNKWADNWLSGKDCLIPHAAADAAYAAAHAAHAADAAYAAAHVYVCTGKKLDLAAIAEQACGI